MISWTTAVVILGACVLVWTQQDGQDGQDLDALIGEIFNSGNKGDNTGVPDLQPNSGGGDNIDEGIPGTGNCKCVSYYLCNNGSINTNGQGIIDIRAKNESGPCRNLLEVCCEPKDTTVIPITPKPPVKPTTGCGHSHPEGVGFRITGAEDNEAQFAEYPWMVAILREESVEGNPVKLNVYQCGGALIHPGVVITAAHCVNGKNKVFKIRAGEWDTQHTQELYPHQDRDVKHIVTHPQYYAGPVYNDVALLFLASPVTIASNVDVVCLPPQNQVVQSGRCFAAGWGKDVFGKQGKYQVILKKIDLPVVPRDTCQDILRTTRLGAYFELHRSFMCAGGEPGKDTCKGDGGSPLVCPIGGSGDRYFQAGIVAWGIGCGGEKVPGVYVNVALFRDWIDEQMQLEGLEKTSYKY